VLTEARRCAVVGSPISHSLSPVLHRAAYEHLGLDWTYEAIELTEDELEPYVTGRDAALRGLSVTMPLKREALKLADRADEWAQTVGAANTLVFEPDGTIEAANTDVSGMAVAIVESSVPPAPRVCLWGGGATAASALLAIATLQIKRVHVHARDASRARAALGGVAAARGLRVDILPWQVDQRCAESGLVISTAPAGAADSVADELAKAASSTRLLFDVIYDPWPTALAAAWESSGGAVASGLDLLVWQAVGQIRLMTGRDVPADVLFAAVR
jgi:shikimate dehydrogenase